MFGKTSDLLVLGSSTKAIRYVLDKHVTPLLKLMNNGDAPFDLIEKAQESSQTFLICAIQFGSGNSRVPKILLWLIHEVGEVIDWKNPEHLSLYQLVLQTFSETPSCL